MKETLVSFTAALQSSASAGTMVRATEGRADAGAKVGASEGSPN